LESKKATRRRQQLDVFERARETRRGHAAAEYRFELLAVRPWTVRENASEIIDHVRGSGRD
jgi:hypothetical protein